jgi:hypothetical protein
VFFFFFFFFFFKKRKSKTKVITTHHANILYKKQNLPMFFWTANTSDPSLHPIGETYYLSRNMTELSLLNTTTTTTTTSTTSTSNGVDLTNFGFLTVALNPADDSIVGLQARGTWIPFDKFGFKNVTSLGSMMYSFCSGRYLGNGTVPLADRMVTNFTRIPASDFSSVRTVAIVDGPDCVPNNGGGGGGDDGDDDGDVDDNEDGDGEERAFVRGCSGKTTVFYIKRARV